MNEFPKDGFTPEQRKGGAVIIHILLVSEWVKFWARNEVDRVEKLIIYVQIWLENRYRSTAGIDSLLTGDILHARYRFRCQK